MRPTRRWSSATSEDIHKRAREAGKVTALVRNPAGGGVGKLAVYLDWRRKQLKELDEALDGAERPQPTRLASPSTTSRPTSSPSPARTWMPRTPAQIRHANAGASEHAGAAA